MAGEGTKRIIDLTETSEAQNGDYLAIDSSSRGTRKLPAGAMATAADLAAEQTARAAADNTLDGKISAEQTARQQADEAEAQARAQAITAEQTAREQADEALDDKIDAEEAARIAADNTLTESIEALDTELTEAESAISGLTSEVYAVTEYPNSTPYLFRETADGALQNYSCEKSTLNKLIGGTVGWNQLQTKFTQPSRTVGGLTTSVDSDGYLTISGTATESVSNLSVLPQISTVPANHVMLFMLDGTVDFEWTRGGFSNWITNKTLIHKYSVAFSAVIYVKINSGQTYDSKFRMNIIDLTAMFGSTIADYIYSLEQATAGAGVAWFRKYFPNSYYAYNSGSLESVEATAHVMTGKNQIDVADGSITTSVNNLTSATLAAGTYTYSGFLSRNDGGSSRLTVHKNGSILVSSINASGTTPMRVSVSFTLTTDTTISLGVQFLSSYDTINYSKLQLEYGSTATDYEPYESHSYPLANITIRGIPKVIDGQLYYDGDEYSADGTVNRKYGIVDLGTLTWSGSGVMLSSSINALVKRPSGNDAVANIISEKYTTSAAAPIGSNDGRIGIDTSGRIQCGTSTTPSGYLVYELATPTTETALPFENPQICDKDGTEEFVSETIVPVGHETDYIVEESKLPSIPTTDGTYTLTATVSGGLPTFAWSAE